MKRIAVVSLLLLLAACEEYACTPESAQKTGEYFARCVQGDGYSRPQFKTCARFVREQKICVERWQERKP